MIGQQPTDDVSRCIRSAAALGQDGGGDILRFSIQDDTCLYGIFDTHNGNDGAKFILQKMAAEILQGRLETSQSDEDIKEILRNAFLSVEKAYIESLDGLVAERTSLQFSLSEDQDQKCATILERLTKIDEQLSIGITAVIALIFNGKLYVANIGNSRALLCKTDDKSVLRYVQLSIDHSLFNEDELLRLSRIGLSINKLRQSEMLGNQSSTRCFGNYLVKALYKAFPDLENATSEPVLAIPEVHGPVELDDSCRFLVLTSDELYKNLQDALETEQDNKHLVQMIVEQFRIQPSLESVCQSVIDKIKELYHENCARQSKTPKKLKRNTLLIRNFNFSLPNGIPVRSPVVHKKTVDNVGVNAQPEAKNIHENRVRFNPVVQSHSPMITDTESDIDTFNSQKSSTMESQSGSNDSNQNSYSSTLMSQFSQNSNNSSSYSPEDDNKMSTNQDEKIDAYVDFSQYYQNIELARLNGTLPANFDFD